MLYRTVLREEAARILLAAQTDAGPNVWTARSLPLDPKALPAIQVQVLADHAESWGPGSPSFTRTCGLLVTARARYVTDRLGGSSDGEIQLDRLCGQIEQALLVQLPLFPDVQKIPTIETDTAFDSTGGDQIAVARLRFDLEYVETFVPNSVPLADIRGTILDPASGSALAVFDAELPQDPLPAPPQAGSGTPFGAPPPFP